MFKKHPSLGKYIAETLTENHVITPEQTYLYQYCIDSLVESLLFLLTILLIGGFAHQLIHTLLFLFCIIPLRSYAGGVHAPNAIQCFFLSLSVYLLVLLASMYVSLPGSWPILIIFVFILAGIAVLAPVASPHKPIGQKKQKLYRLISFIICLICFALGFYLWYNQLYVTFRIIFWTCSLELLSQLAGKVLYKRL